jgi:hypothetical protein
MIVNSTLFLLQFRGMEVEFKYNQRNFISNSIQWEWNLDIIKVDLELIPPPISQYRGMEMEFRSN